jgi:hypothetical protein
MITAVDKARMRKTPTTIKITSFVFRGTFLNLRVPDSRKSGFSGKD